MSDKWERLKINSDYFENKDLILKIFEEIKNSPDYSKESSNEVGKKRLKMWEMYYIGNESQKRIGEKFNISSSQSRTYINYFTHRILKPRIRDYYIQQEESEVNTNDLALQISELFQLNPNTEYSAKFSDNSTMTINSINFIQSSNCWYVNYTNSNEKIIYSEKLEKVKYIYKDHKTKNVVIDLRNKKIVQALI